MTEQTEEKQDVQKEQNSEGSDKNENVVKIDRTEYDAMTTKVADMDALIKIAAEADMTPMEYLEALEDKKFGEMEKAAAANTEVKPAEAESKPSGSAPVENEEIKMLKTKLQETQAQANYGRVEIDWINFQQIQSALPEEERSPFTKKEIFNLLNTKNGQLAISIAGEHDNNVVKAANHILMVTKGVTKARQVGAEEERKKQVSADTGKLPTGGATKTEQSETKEEKEKKEMSVLLDDTCGPDDAVYVMPTDR